MKIILPEPYILPLPVIYQVRGKQPRRHLDNRIHIHQIRYLSSEPEVGTPRPICRSGISGMQGGERLRNLTEISVGSG